MRSEAYIPALLDELKGAVDDVHAAAIRAELRAAGYEGAEATEPAKAPKSKAPTADGSAS